VRADRPPRRLLATLLSLAGLAYAGLWSAHSLRAYDSLSDRLGLPDNALAPRVVELGFDIEYDRGARGVRVTQVRPRTPAEAAGVRAGDLVVAVNARPVRDGASPLGEVYLAGRPGETVDLAVLRGDDPSPTTRRAVFRERGQATSVPALLRAVIGTTVLFPFVLLAVALPVLFYRLDDRNAWLVAALFLCLAAAPGFPNSFASLDGPASTFAMAYRSVFGGLLGALFYALFAVFPERSPLDRLASWLKWALAGAGLTLGLAGMRVGDPSVPAAVRGVLGDEASRALALTYRYGAVALGLASLAANAWRPSSPEARRKIEMIVWGTAAGILPAASLGLLEDSGWRVPNGLSASSFLLMFLFPLAFAYAVVKHRVLELPVLLKRSARYLLVRRGFWVLLVVLGLAANALFAFSFPRLFDVDATLATSAGVGFGLALASVSAPGVRRATRRIDRAFFREAYDARVVLEDLAARIRAVEDPGALAELLEGQVRRALQPRSVHTLLEARDGSLRAPGSGPSAVGGLAAGSPGLAALAADPRPREFRAPDGQPRVAALEPLAPDLLVPVVARGRLLGLVALGPRLSEEPYSGEDARLLSTVAAQAAVVLENLSLASRMAERLEAERRAAHEMELARRVQAQLLPRGGRRTARLECEGRCVQARAVGGDYFDFVDASEDRLGLVLADVSGKGLAAALLMASLHASLRTLAPQGADLPARLAAVNRLLVESTEPSRYATLFVAEADGASGRLRYCNCGHNPPFVVRADATVERLAPTAMVIGLVEPWAAEVREVELRTGDLLVAYSDGLSEAMDEAGEEFGEKRLIGTVESVRARPLPEVLDAVYSAVRRFSVGEQADDQTLLVARSLSPSRPGRGGAPGGPA
jgi:sigma-B regulation protein RsbU (phosphoserine phosphatase)